jgi:hypothetical protein
VDPTRVSPALRDAINTRLSEILKQWTSVPVGGDLVLQWPRYLTIKRGQI